jgi:hypothetical protein
MVGMRGLRLILVWLARVKPRPAGRTCLRRVKSHLSRPKLKPPCGGLNFGRDERIRTSGLFDPNEARYRAALRQRRINKSYPDWRCE